MPGPFVELAMLFDEELVEELVTPDVAKFDFWRRQWGQMMETSLWGDIRSHQIGSAGRLRKRILELGEKLRSYGSDRKWIPHPRERIKNCLASGLHLREAMDRVAESMASLEGGESLATLEALWDTLSGSLQEDLGLREARLVALLNQQYGEEQHSEEV